MTTFDVPGPLVLALYSRESDTDPPELSRSHRIQRFENRRHQREQMKHTVGGRPYQKYAQLNSCNVLLELKVAVHC